MSRNIGWQSVQLVFPVEFKIYDAEKKYSVYYEELDVDAKKWYDQTLTIIGKKIDDPYTFIPLARPSTGLPNIKYPYSFNLFINTPSPYTREELGGLQKFGRLQIFSCRLGK